jgi:twinkle protein
MISAQTIEEIRSATKIADVINEFVTLKKNGSDWESNCPFHDEKTPSFKVNVKDNFFKCFGCGAAGGSIDFLQKFNNWTFQQSILHLANKYKIQVEEEGVKKTYVKPEWKNNTTLSDKLVKWFGDKRGISQATLKIMQIGESKQWMPEHKYKVGEEVKTLTEGERTVIEFNYFRDGKFVNSKFRDAVKCMRSIKGAELIFYNIDSLINAKDVYIVEGEADVLTLVECGLGGGNIGIISVPNGANIKSNNLIYLDSAIELLDKIPFTDKPIFHIGTDNDIAGRKLREDLAERLGKDRCDFIEWKDCKDSNEVLVKYGKAGVLECIGSPKRFPVVGAFSPGTFKNAVDDLFVNGIDRGIGIGIEGFDELLRFVPGYITLITGYPNHGKSDWLDEMCTRLMVNHGWKGAYYSPENFPIELHLTKIARKVIGKNWYGKEKMNDLEKNLFMEYIEGKMWFIAPEKDFTIESILKTVKGLKLAYGIKYFCVDAWNRLEHKYQSTDSVKYINESLVKIDNFCKDNMLHCFLVAHPARPEADRKTGALPIPTMYSVSGGAQFNNIIANGISVYRDFGEFNPTLKRYDNQITKVFVQKVRMQPYWGHQGYCRFKYDSQSGRFNEYGGDNTIFDYSNWITKINRQSKIETDEPIDYNKIGSDNDILPF